MVEFRKLISEPSVFLLIFISLLLIKLTFPKDLGNEIITIYGTMLFGGYILWSFGSDVRNQSGNTAQALLYALIALGILFAGYQFTQFLFKQSVFPLQATEQQVTQ